MFSKARIPYGTWGSSFFPSWQASPLAEVNIGQFAGEAAARILGLRGVSTSVIDYVVAGSTIPWHYKFWNGPLVASFLGRRLPGFHLEEGCATGLQAVMAAAGVVESDSSDVVGVVTFDRTSDSPVGVFPERRSLRRTQALNDVWDNFGFDPTTGGAMIATAGNVARKHKINRAEVDELAFLRYQQYHRTMATDFSSRFLVPLGILDSRGQSLGYIDKDLGVRQWAMSELKAQREIDTCVTAGTQTHPADGMSCLLVTTKEKARELGPRPEIEIELVGKTEVRALPGLMPEAPALASLKLFRLTGLSASQMAVVKSHNPFALNDVIFSRLTGYDWQKMNRTGCSLVYGHPQAPTLTRTLIEALEEAVDLGGGYVLVCGCAAGDVGIAAIFKVDKEVR